MAWLHTVIDVPTELYASTAEFWQQALGWPLGDQWPGHPELRSFEPPDGAAYVHLQQVVGPPRVHVDVECADPKASIQAALDRGAEVTGRFERWVSLRSPGGKPFCVLPAAERLAPEPVAWPSGHRSRVVQVCIDSPGRRHDNEVGFWRHLLAGRWIDHPS
ncbi:MAG: VOC family protein, partial [Ornithinibacter sp.]